MPLRRSEKRRREVSQSDDNITSRNKRTRLKREVNSPVREGGSLQKIVIKTETSVLSEISEGNVPQTSAKKELACHINEPPTTESDSESDGDDSTCDYEKKRLQNIQANSDFFSKLGINEAKLDIKKASGKYKVKPATKKTKVTQVAGPRRVSLRLKRIDPEGLPLPPIPVQPDPIEEHVRKPSGPLQMEEYLFGGSTVEDHQDLLSCTKHLHNTKAGTKESDKPAAKLVKEFSRLRLSERGVAKVVPNRVFSLAVHHSQDIVLAAAGGKWGKVGLWNVEHSQKESSDGIVVYEPHSRPVSCLRFSPHSSHKMYSCSYDGTFRCCDLEKGVFDEIYSTPVEEDNLLRCFDFLSPDTMLVSQQDGCLALVDSRTKGCEAQHTYYLSQKSLRTVSIHPLKSHMVATAGQDGSVCIWDTRVLSSGNKLNKSFDFIKHGKGVNSAYFSPITGKYLLSVSMDNKISVLDSSNLAELRTHKAISHDNYVGRWLTNFRATWHPLREDLFVIGSMKRPRQIEMFNTEGALVAEFQSEENLGSVCSLNVIHPHQNIVIGANSSGRLHAFM